MSLSRQIIPCIVCKGSCVDYRKEVTHYDEKHWVENCLACNGEGLMVEITEIEIVERYMQGQHIRHIFKAISHEKLNGRKPREIYRNFGQENAT